MIIFWDLDLSTSEFTTTKIGRLAAIYMGQLQRSLQTCAFSTPSSVAGDQNRFVTLDGPFP